MLSEATDLEALSPEERVKLDLPTPELPADRAKREPAVGRWRPNGERVPRTADRTLMACRGRCT
jgi:hypothetical protein